MYILIFLYSFIFFTFITLFIRFVIYVFLHIFTYLILNFFLCNCILIWWASELNLKDEGQHVTITSFDYYVPVIAKVLQYPHLKPL